MNVEGPGTPMPALSTLLCPPEIAETTASAVKPLSKTKLKRLGRALIPDMQNAEKHLPTTSAAEVVHHEKIAPVGGVSLVLSSHGTL